MKAKKQKQKHELSAKSFRALIENAHDGIVVYNTDGTIRYASASVKNILGYKQSNLLGKNGAQFVHPDDVAHAREVFAKLLKKPGKTTTLYQRIRHKRGDYFWIESLLTNYCNLPEVNGIVSNFRDCSDEKLVEEEARRTKDLLETINRNVTEGIFMGKLGSNLIYVNDAFVKMTGYKSRAALMKIDPKLLYVNNDSRQQIISALRKKSTVKGVHTQFRKKNGEPFWVTMNVSLLRHEGKADHYVGSIRDITHERKIEQELIESRNFLKDIIRTVAAPLFVKDHKHRWVMLNDRFAQLIGHPEKELLGKTDKDFLSADEAGVFWKIDNEVLRTGRTILNEEQLSTPTGRRDLLTVKSRFVTERGEKFVIGFISDITPINRVKEKLGEVNANLKGVMESTRESIYAIDTRFRYLTFNANHERIMKLLYRATIQEGKNKIDYLKNSNEGAWVKAELKKAMRGVPFVSEHELNYRNFTGHIQSTYNPIRDEKGEVTGVAVFVKDITERKQFEQIIAAINANLRAVLESTADRILAVDRKFRYITFNNAHKQSIKRNHDIDIKPGDDFLKVISPNQVQPARDYINRALKGEQFLRETELPNKMFLETTFNPIYNDDDGKIRGVAMFMRDVTERKRIEEKMRSLNHELVEQNKQLASQEEVLRATLAELSERNFELDQLMYKTSHDLRSPLSSIMGLVNLANLDKDQDARDSYLKKIEGRIQKLDEFIRSMLDYARVNRAENAHENIDLPQLIQACIRELEYLENFPAVQTAVSVTSNEPFWSDPLRVKIVFANIISNAYKYCNADVQSYLTVSVSVDADLAHIEFADNGIGIKEEHLGKIFNMFYRATDRSQGSGLGMYIVKQAVERLGGKVTIASAYGEGTTIRLTLPNARH